MSLNPHHIFWANLEKIKITLLKSDAEFDNYIGLVNETCEHYQKTGRTLPMNLMFELAERLNFHFEVMSRSPEGPALK